MVDSRIAGQINRRRELLVHLDRLRLEAKEQRREAWLQKARTQAARIANRTASSVSKESSPKVTLACQE